MHIKLKRNIFFYIVGLTLFFKCAYFNTFYNAEQSFDKALKIIENSPILNDSKIPSEAVDFLNQTIKNCNIVIEKYPDSKYIDKAYLLIGVSFFYKGLYKKSTDSLGVIIDSDDSEIKNKAILWSAYSFLKLNHIEKTSNYLDMISINAIDREDLYVFYNIKAEINVLDENVEKAYESYISASDSTSKNSRKIHIYRKLIKLSEETNDLNSKTKFIELLEEYVEESNKIKDLKIEWIESKNKLGHYNDVISEIDLVMDAPLFSTIKPQLMIYKAKAYKNSNRITLAKEILDDITTDFSKKNETSEAYYILASISMFEDFNLEQAKEYLEKSIDEKSRSEYGKKSKKLKAKIDDYEELRDDYDYFKNNSIIDTAYVSDDEDNMNMSLPEIDEDVLLDSLLFNIGQIFYFDFNQIDSALNRYEYILRQFPDSKYKNQLSYIMDYHNNSDSIIIEEEAINQNLDSLSLKRDEAWNLNNIKETLDFFNSMYDEYNDSIAFFNIAYIQDNFFHNLRESVPIYYQIQEEYPRHPSISYINQRLIELSGNLNNLITDNQGKIDFENAFSLIENNNLDSAKKVLQNIEASRKTPLYQTIRDLIKSIDDYNDLRNKYDSELSNDSTIFHLGRIDYYYFNETEESILKFKKIIEEYPESEYINQSAWILSQISEEYKKDSINYDLIDTSQISFNNPIKSWDMKKIRNDYEKLNNLYKHFKEKD